MTGKLLFTPETRVTVTEQMKHAGQIQDACDLDQIYLTIPPTSSTRHGLPEYVSLRCESKLEGFHHPLANFANTAMRASLCDNLNLIGTSRYNVKIRHRLVIASDPESRPNITAYWANYPAFTNHSELAYVNGLAEATGYPRQPFQHVRPLPEDNGERFFSEYLVQQRERAKKYTPSPLNDRCQCPSCGTNTIPLWHESVLQEEGTASGRHVMTPEKPKTRILMTDTPFEYTYQPSSPESPESAAPPFTDDILASPTQGNVLFHPSPNIVDLAMGSQNSVPVRSSVPEPLPWQHTQEVQPQTPSQQKLQPLEPTLMASTIEAHPKKRKRTSKKHQVSVPIPTEAIQSTAQQSLLTQPPFFMMFPPFQGYGNFLSNLQSQPDSQTFVMPAWGGVQTSIQQTKRPKAQQQLCCQPFIQWASKDNRNGRPPHAKDCHNRRG